MEASAIKLQTVPRLAHPHVTTVEWRATSLVIVPWKQRRNRATNVVWKGISPVTALKTMVAMVVDSDLLARNVTVAGRLATSLVHALRVPAAMLVMPVEALAVTAAGRLVTLAGVWVTCLGTVYRGPSVITALEWVTLAGTALNLRGVLATLVARRDIFPATALELLPLWRVLERDDMISLYC